MLSLKYYGGWEDFPTKRRFSTFAQNKAAQGGWTPERFYWFVLVYEHSAVLILLVSEEEEEENDL